MHAERQLGTLRAAFVACVLAVATAVAGPAAAQEALDPGRLVGVWQGYERTGDLTVAGEMILYPNGAYQRKFVLGQLMTFHSGNWTVSGNWLHFQPTDYEPKVYSGIQQSPPPSETWIVDQFNGAVLHGAVGMTEVAYQRVN